MPQFQMPVSDMAAWNDLDEFTKGAIECAFFSDAGPDDECHGANFEDLAPDSLESFIEECKHFQLENAELLDAACQIGDYDMTRAGHDFWYTRGGAGVGYWDRELGHVGDDLTEATGRGETALYWGSDRKVYIYFT